MFLKKKCDTPFEKYSDLCDLFNEIFKTGNWGVTVVISRSFIFVVVAIVIVYSNSRARARTRSIFPKHVFLWSFTVTRLSDSYRAEALIPTEGGEKHKKGGLNCVFKNFFFLLNNNCSQDQSLIEFRVWPEFRVLVQRIESKNA